MVFSFPRHAAHRGVAVLLLMALTASLPLADHAGRAQVGIGMGTWANTDLDGASASGQSWRDGAPLQTASDAAAPPAKDWATVALQVDGVARSTSAAVTPGPSRSRARMKATSASALGAIMLLTGMGWPSL